jgi:hypothetical protein
MYNVSMSLLKEFFGVQKASNQILQSNNIRKKTQFPVAYFISIASSKDKKKKKKKKGKKKEKCT